MNLDRCENCVSELEKDNSVLFEMEDGSVLCRDCAVEYMKGEVECGSMLQYCTGPEGAEYGYCVSCENLFVSDDMTEDVSKGLLCKECARDMEFEDDGIGTDDETEDAF